MEENYLFRILDCGEFNNSEEMIDHLRRNGYKSFVEHIIPFIELEVPEFEFYEVKTILDQYFVQYRVF